MFSGGRTEEHTNFMKMLRIQEKSGQGVGQKVLQKVAGMLFIYFLSNMKR